MTVRTFKKNSKLTWEEVYVNDYLIGRKYWYYEKDVYGYYLFDKRKNKSKIVQRKDFYPGGKLKIEGSTISGEKHGKYKTYYQNGQMECDCNYQEGKRDSTQIVYFENGQIDCIVDFQNGKENGIAIYYFSNGQLWSERIYNNGKFWEILSNFNKNGTPVEKGTLKDGSGTIFFYDENGKLTEIEHYKKGKLIKTENENAL